MLRRTILFLAATLCTSAANAQFATGVDSLEGMQTVQVMVSIGADPAVHLQFGQQQIVTDAELRLRKGGLRVLSGGEKPDGLVLVKIIVHARDDEPNLYCYYVGVQVQQAVGTLRSRHSLIAATWEADALGSVGSGNSESAIRRTVSDKVDEMLNDWLKAKDRASQASLELTPKSGTPQGAADDEPVWAPIRKAYPGVDVKTLWSAAFSDAVKVTGVDPAKSPPGTPPGKVLYEYASKLFHERAAAAVKARLEVVPVKAEENHSPPPGFELETTK